MNLVHSNNEPGVSSPTNHTKHIDVRFVPFFPIQLQIKNSNSNSMKTSGSTPKEMTIPSLFQIAAHFETVTSSAGSKESAPELNETPFTELISHPKKLERALKAARAENDAFDASRTISCNEAKRPTRSSPPVNDVAKKNKASLTRELKKIEFFLEAPSATSVRLAADFTDWEKYPLDMIRSDDGVWFNVISLAPGHYSYRYIVDGQWHDDPRSTQRVANPFGTENALLIVT